MKNILIAVLVLGVNFCSAQVYVNQIDVNKFDYQYLEVWEQFDKETGKFNAMIDYGQMTSKSDNGAIYRVNELNGAPMKFNSTIAMLNFLFKNGWELVSIKTINEINSYIMKRIDQKDEMKETTEPSSESEEDTSKTEKKDED